MTRLTRNAALLARVLFVEIGAISPDLIDVQGARFGIALRDRAVLLAALNECGAEGVRALAHADEDYRPDDFREMLP